MRCFTFYGLPVPCMTLTFYLGQFLPARQHSKLRTYAICKRWYCYSRDVRPSVGGTRIVSKQTSVMISSPTGTGRLTFLQIHFQVHPEIRKQLHRKMAHIGQVRIGDFDLEAAVSPKGCKIVPSLPLISNRKSHMPFRLIPKSMDDLE